tara:strand:- start:256 stop:489 length:234 start_codon:yes stop_codon:yes gene_type:complete
MKKMSKLKHQIKSNKYYLFWGAATIAVIFGQIYVGNGFRKMAESNNAISADLNLLIENIMFAVPQQQEYYSDPMVIQ